MWGVSFVFVSSKSGWLSDSTIHTNLKIFGAPPRPRLGAYSYTKTPSRPLSRFARTYFCLPLPPLPQSFLHRYAPDRGFMILISCRTMHFEILKLKQIFRSNRYPNNFVDRYIKIHLDKVFIKHPNIWIVLKKELACVFPFFGKKS